MLTIKTKTGSVYQVDLMNMAWQRVMQGEDSTLIKTDSGRLVSVPDIEVGKSLILKCPSYQDTPGRVIETSDVVEII